MNNKQLLELATLVATFVGKSGRPFLDLTFDVSPSASIRVWVGDDGALVELLDNDDSEPIFRSRLVRNGRNLPTRSVELVAKSEVLADFVGVLEGVAVSCVDELVDELAVVLTRYWEESTQ